MLMFLLKNSVLLKLISLMLKNKIKVQVPQWTLESESINSKNIGMN